MEREQILPWQTPEIEKAFDELELLSRDPAFRWQYEDRYKALMDHIAALHERHEQYQRGIAEGRAEGRSEGRAEGRSEGRAEGRSEGRAEGEREALLRVAGQMLQEGLSIEQIAAITGLAAKEIEALRLA